MQKLIDACFQQDDKLYLCVSSPTIKDKPVSLFTFLFSRTELDTPSRRMTADLYLFRWTEANAIRIAKNRKENASFCMPYIGKTQFSNFLMPYLML